MLKMIQKEGFGPLFSYKKPKKCPKSINLCYNGTVDPDSKKARVSTLTSVTGR